MFLPFSCIFIGIALGLLAKRTVLLALAGKLFMPIVCVLLFAMGYVTGGNAELMAHLPMIGVHALVLAVATIAGSVLCVCLICPFLSSPKGGGKGCSKHGAADSGAGGGSAGDDAPGGSSAKTSLILVGIFALGILSGFFHVLPEGWVTNEVCMVFLLALMLAVGIGMSAGGRLRSVLRSISPRLLLFPLATTVGTFLGAAVCAPFMFWSVLQCLAVGSGFAYYSLSSVLIAQAGHVELGTVALVSNILRESIALVLIPFAARFLPGHAVVSMAGCTSLDTSFPVLVRTLGMDWAFVCLFHGMALDFAVPFWVAFYCSLL